MKIGNNLENLSQIQTAQVQAAQIQTVQTQALENSASPNVGSLLVSVPAVSTPGDTAHLSSVGGQVTQATSAPDVRLDKVAAIQSALAAGTYSVSASQVASKLVDSMLEEKL